MVRQGKKSEIVEKREKKVKGWVLLFENAHSTLQVTKSVMKGQKLTAVSEISGWSIFPLVMMNAHLVDPGG